ncbi:MAG: quinone-dependent dihydroorotate dehydrogenase [Thermoanaerobaculia bacterium]
MLYRLLRPLLFALDAERAHGLAVEALGAMQRLRPLRWAVGAALRVGSPRLEQDLLGLRFPLPVGLAAGFDKEGRLVAAFDALGAGSIEVGTVTPQPQDGNPRPRMFRFPAQQSLRNSLGFNNGGMSEVEKNLRSMPDFSIPVGINIGKNRATDIEVADGDYAMLAQRLGGLAGYLTVNVSSPNTPGLRSLQDPERLASLVAAVRRVCDRPLLVKIAPDLDAGRAIDLCEAALAAGARGIVATNTTTEAGGLPGARSEGGTSGAALRPASRAMLRTLAPRLAGRCILVSVGGVDSADEAYARLRAGASLVQLYSGLVFRGPGLFAAIHRGLLRRMDRDGHDSISGVIGADL